MAAGVLAFVNTRRYGGRSPAELVYGHWVREPLPVHRASLEDPRWAKDPVDLDIRAEVTKEKLRETYDEHARDLEPLPIGTPVSVLERDANGKPLFRNTGVVVEVKPKRMYKIKQYKGCHIERNRRHLLRRYLYGVTSGPFVAPPEEDTGAPPRQVVVAPPLPPFLPEVVGLPLRPAAVRQPQRRPPPPPREQSTRVKKPNPNFVGKGWTK